MQIYKSLTAPSVVTHSLHCKFTGSDDLIIVRGSSLLQLYKTIRTQTHIVNSSSDKEEEDAAVEERLLEGQDTFIGMEIALETAREEFSEKLVLVKEWPLFGQVTGIEKIRTLSHPKTDSLLVSFKYAKMAVISWEPSQQSIATQSLHYYEKDLFEKSFIDPMFPSKLCVDPHSSSATLLYQKDTFVFLPFAQDDLFEDGIGTIGSSNLQKQTQPQTQPTLTPIYKPSFILRSHQLHESITNVIDFAYLFEYREPTIAVLFEPTRTWASRIQLEKDTISYLVLSLDLQQKTFTSIVSAQNLPYNIQKIIPLKDPIGGSLLIGNNEFVHIDSQGRVNGVAVNPLHKISTDLTLKDQMSLELSLDSCIVTQLKGAENEALVILESGELLNLRFHIESRKVHDITVISIPCDIFLPNPSTVSSLNSRYVFAGSTTSDSKLIQWKREGETTVDEDKKTAIPTIRQPTEQKPSEGYDDIDDIYGDVTMEESGSKNTALTHTISDSPIVFRVSDRLNNYGPINDMAICKSRKGQQDESENYDVVAATGTGVDGSLTIFNRKIRPSVVSKLKLKNSFSRIWTLNPSGISNSGDDLAEENVFDTFLIGSNSTTTFLFKIGEEFEDITSSVSKFKSDSPTLSAKVMFNGKIVVQVCPSTILIYDSDMTYITKKSLKDEPSLVTYAEEFIVLHSNESKQTVYQIQEKGDSGWTIIEKSLPAKLPNSVYLSAGCSTAFSSFLAADNKRIKRKRDEEEIEMKELSVPIAYTSSENSLHVYFLRNITVKFDLSALLHLPNVLKLDGTAFVEDDPPPQPRNIEIKQLVHFKLKNSIEEKEYFAILTSFDKLYLYNVFCFNSKVYFVKARDGYSLSSLNSNTTQQSQNAVSKIVPYENIGGFSGIFVLGSKPTMILKEPQGNLQCHSLSSKFPILGFTSFNTPSVYGGLAYVDSEYVLRIGTLPEEVDFSYSWPSRKISLGAPVLSLCYHETGDVLAVSIADQEGYQALDPEGNPIPDLNMDMPRPVSYKTHLKLISPLNWTVIDEVEYQSNESIMTLKTVFLEVSEKTKLQKEFIVAGTSIIRGEDLAAMGGFYIYEAIEVVPEPGRPETSHKLKQVASEISKGAVTSISEVSGHLLIAQAQKVSF